jgi:hypothetical protein
MSVSVVQHLSMYVIIVYQIDRGSISILKFNYLSYTIALFIYRVIMVLLNVTINTRE